MLAGIVADPPWTRTAARATVPAGVAGCTPGGAPTTPATMSKMKSSCVEVPSRSTERGRQMIRSTRSELSGGDVESHPRPARGHRHPATGGGRPEGAYEVAVHGGGVGSRLEPLGGVAG